MRAAGIPVAFGLCEAEARRQNAPYLKLLRAGRPYVHAVSERLGPDARDASFRLLERTPEIVGWLEDRLGDYPYVSTGGVVSGIGRLGFALETASRPVYPYVGGPGYVGNIALVVHEQAHQWFGDDVSIRRWHDL